MIEVVDLHFSYGENNVFNGFNINIDSKIFGLIGINGAGKSTLLKLCAGLLRPDQGDLFLEGCSVVNQRDEVLKHIGVLHENPTFPPWANVLPYLRCVGELRGLTTNQAQSQALYLLNELDLIERKNDKVSDLSAGLTQRFGLAQAIIGVPNIIFLDEPTANLDAKSRISVLDFLKQITRNFKCQIIIMSHVLSDLERFCDEVAILHEGKTMYQNTIAHLLSEQAHRYYSIKGPERDISTLFSSIQDLNVKIIRHEPLEIVIEIEEKSELVSIQTIPLPQGVVISPTRSLLEQLFLDLTTDT